MKEEEVWSEQQKKKKNKPGETERRRRREWGRGDGDTGQDKSVNTKGGGAAMRKTEEWETEESWRGDS